MFTAKARRTRRSSILALFFVAFALVTVSAAKNLIAFALVILSAAKNLVSLPAGDETLRCAQRDKGHRKN